MAKSEKSRELSVGSTLYKGKYIIEKVLGMGGFGITYYAKHSALNKYYAIKEFFISGYCVRSTQTRDVQLQGIPKEKYEEYKENFIKEAQTLVTLDHPNIVKVIDVFHENKTSYMVMDFVEGVTLQQLVDQKGKLDYETVVNYIAQLSNAVAYIHEHKPSILHRDIKPGNIILTPDYRVVLIDFGSAREVDKTHTIMLTEGYAPPEQYSSTSKKGYYSDIYSLGAVFYFALTGQKPIDAAVRTMQTMPEPKELISTIPEEANHTIMKAMQLKPEDRYQVVSEFMDDLLGQKPLTIIRPHNKKLLFTGIIMTVVILFGIGIYFFTKKISGNIDNHIVKTEVDSTNEKQTSPVENQSTTPAVSIDTMVPMVHSTIPPKELPQSDNKKKEPETNWISEYNKVITQANNYYTNFQIPAAIDEYKKALELIPASDKSNKRKEVTEKIALYENQYDVINAWNAAINSARMYLSSNDYVTAKKYFENALSIAQTKGNSLLDDALLADFIRISKQGINDCEQKIQDELDTVLMQASSAFSSGQYEKAFELYKKIKSIDPNDNTGYRNFINKAKEVIPYTGYDSFVKDKLLKAKELRSNNININEINTLLSNCK